MHEKISTQQLEQALRGEFKTLVVAVADAVNQAQAGRIIADSEEAVRQATARFRQRVYQKALQLRQQHSEPAFSPSAPRTAASLGE